MLLRARTIMVMPLTILRRERLDFLAAEYIKEFLIIEYRTERQQCQISSKPSNSGPRNKMKFLQIQ